MNAGNLLDLIVLALFVWRLSSLLVTEDGPPLYKVKDGEWWNLFEWIRFKVGVRFNQENVPYASGWAEVFLCVWCMSLWVSFAVFAAYLLLGEWRWVLILAATPFALSAAAIVVEEMVSND